MVEVMRDVVVDPAVLEEFKRILLAQREDTKKEFAAIAGALALYNRYGEDSPYRRVLSNDALRALTGEELRSLIAGLLNYPLRVQYTGSLPQEKVQASLKARLPETATRLTVPDYVFLRAAAPEKHRIYFTHKEQAQAQVRIEFADGEVNELDFPAVQLFNDYFGGGMAGIVFQELREARALAYSVGAVYGMGSRLKEQNLVTGGIGTQADKTVDALVAFLKLFDELPESPERFTAAKDSILNTYRTTRVGFRSVLDVVEAWERLGLPVDPRRGRYQKVLKAELPLVMRFHAERLRDRPKLISIVGDRSRINLEALKQLGDFRELPVDDLFAF
jgi:predicted Zn-dependent peptidase